jgi:hypothetical protein
MEWNGMEWKTSHEEVFRTEQSEVISSKAAQLDSTNRDLAELGRGFCNYASCRFYHSNLKAG